MLRIWRQVRTCGQALWKRNRLDAEMHDEMGFHLEMETARLMRELGLPPDEARRRAFVAFGGVEKYKQAGRELRPLGWVDAVSLDIRLGVRLLVKHRALTCIGSFALAVAIAVGATSFEIITDAMYGTLPVDEGDRVVAVHYATGNPGDREQRIVSDFLIWREKLASIHQLGAFRTLARSLVMSDASPEPIFVAEMSANGFAVARTPPLLGRYLVADDERSGAGRTIVIGYRAWQSRFRADPDIVGRTITLDADPHVVVGVMPDGFRFPINHDYWIPFRAQAGPMGPLEGPQIQVFGRLAAGVSFQQAQAELTAVAQQSALRFPAQYEHMRAVLVPYARGGAEVDEPVIAWMMWLVQLLLTALVAVVGINVAILRYAMTMARRSEMAMRAALGASRLRLLTQLFVEALGLSTLGAALGLVLSEITLQQILVVLVDSGATLIPYWIDLTVSPSTVMYAMAMAVTAAFVVGVLPALKLTGPGLQDKLRELGGGATVRLGRTWSFLIIAQVTVAVAVLPVAILMVWEVAQIEAGDPGFPVERYAVAEVSPGPRDLPGRLETLMERLGREPDVSMVAYSSAVPGSASAYRRLEFDVSGPAGGAGDLAAEVPLRPAGVLRIGLGMFDAYSAQLIAGRTFRQSDLNGTDAVVVDRTFVEMFMGTRPVLGQRFRYIQMPGQEPDSTDPSPWYEVVGVVNPFPAFEMEPATERQPIVYHVAAPDQIRPAMLNVRFASAVPPDLVGRLRRAAGEVDPVLQLRNAMPLTESYDKIRSFGRLLAFGLGAITASVLLLSAAGTYALLSFTVAQRAREIGIRTALGASPRRIVTGVFGRVTRQVALGLTVGSLLASIVVAGMRIDRFEAMTLLLIVPTIIVVVGLGAALGPTRRSLRLPTTEALRS